MYRVRDAFLRCVANRRGIVVPSLVADVRVDDDETASRSTSGARRPARGRARRRHRRRGGSPGSGTLVSEKRHMARAARPQAGRRRRAAFPLGVLFGLNLVDELDRVAFGVLAPDIQRRLQPEHHGLIALAAAIIPVALLLELPIAYLADRRNRVRMTAVAAFVWAAFSGLTGLAAGVAVLALSPGWARPSPRRSRDAPQPAGRLLPVGSRGPRVFYAHQFANSIGIFLGHLGAGLWARCSAGARRSSSSPSRSSSRYCALRLKEPIRGLQDGSPPVPTR